MNVSFRNIAIILLAAAGCACLPGVAEAKASTDVRAYCRAHPHSAGPGEEAQADVPRMVRAVRADHWRCQNGKAMVCYGGASGRACLRTRPMDTDRLRAFRDFCRANPGEDIPYALTAGLATPDWRCAGARPVASNPVPADRDGYLVDNWRPLDR